MRCRTPIRTIAAATGMTAIALSAGAASASAAIVPTPDRGPELRRAAKTLARAIVADPRIIRRAAFSVLPPGGNPAAVSTTPLARFPRAGDSFGMLSTGDATVAGNPNSAPDTSTATNGPFLRGARDVTIFKIKFKRPKGANCLSIRFRFLSEEFPEFKDSEFNDGFIAELDKSTWRAASNEDPTVMAPRNFAIGSNGQRVSVNRTSPATVKAKRAKGTTYDAATRLLRASAPVGGGSVHTVYFSIFDQGDRLYDSAVFLDRMTVDKQSNCKSGIVGA